MIVIRCGGAAAWCGTRCSRRPTQSWRPRPRSCSSTRGPASAPPPGARSCRGPWRWVGPAESQRHPGLCLLLLAPQDRCSELRPPFQPEPPFPRCDWAVLLLLPPPPRPSHHPRSPAAVPPCASCCPCALSAPSCAPVQAESGGHPDVRGSPRGRVPGVSRRPSCASRRRRPRRRRRRRGGQGRRGRERTAPGRWQNPTDSFPPRPPPARCLMILAVLPCEGARGGVLPALTRSPRGRRAGREHRYAAEEAAATS